MGRIRNAWSALTRKSAPGSVTGEELAALLVQAAKPPRKGTKELVQAYKQLPWLRAASHRIATSIAAVPWRTYKAAGRRGAKSVLKDIQGAPTRGERVSIMRRALATQDLVEVENHPLLELLDAPNEKTTGRSFRQIVQIHLDLVGTSYWAIEMDLRGAQPSEIWAMPPHWLQKAPTATHPTYQFSAPGMGRIEIPEGQVVVVCDPDPDNPYGTGAGVGHALGQELESDEQAASAAARRFANGGAPETIISVVGAGTPVLERLRDEWDNKFATAQRTGRPQFVNKEMQVERLGFSFADLELVAFREFMRNLIIQVFGVPPEVLGIVEDSNRAHALVSKFAYAEWCLTPRLELWRTELQHHMLPRFGDDNLVILYDSPVPEDREFQLKVLQSSPWAWSADEIRDLAEEAPLPDNLGDYYTFPAGTTPVKAEDLNEFIENRTFPVMPSFGEPAGLEGPDDSEDGTFDSEKNARVRGASGIPLDPPWAENMGGDSAPVVGSSTSTKRAGVSPIVAQIVDRLSPEQLMIPLRGVWEQHLLDRMKEEIAGLGADVDFEILNPIIRQHLSKAVYSRLENITATNKQRVLDTLSEGMALGEGQDDLAKRVRSVIGESASWRAPMIARTEVGRSANFAKYQAQSLSGIVEERVWVATPDDRTRDEHWELDGQVVGIQQPFTIDGYSAMYPGSFGVPELDINCRCTTAAVTRDPIQYEERRALWKAYDESVIGWEKRAIMAFKEGLWAQADLLAEAIKLHFRE